jgi:hypothetical protein
VPTRVDWTGLPLVPAAVALRTIGEGLLTTLLEGGYNSAWVPALLPEQAALFVLHRTGDPVTLTREAVAGATGAPDPGRDWQAGMAAYLSWQPGPTGHEQLPHLYWPTAGVLAWHDLDFQILAAQRVHLYLLNRVLLGGRVPVPHIDTRTYWLLLLLVPVATGPQLDPAVMTGIQRLQAVARGIVERGQWAGFWDQWLVAEALLRWPGQVSELSDSLRAALDAWPLIGAARHILVGEGAALDADAALVRPGWQRGIPDWFGVYVRWQWAGTARFTGGNAA